MKESDKIKTDLENIAKLPEEIADKKRSINAKYI